MRKRLISDGQATCAPDRYFHSDDRKGKEATAAAMDQPVQRMTLQELRDELERTRPAWEAEVADLDGVLVDGELAALSEHAHRHQMVADELLRRPSDG